MPQIPQAVKSHYRQMQRLQYLGLTLARRSWRKISLNQIRTSWAMQSEGLSVALGELQVRAATAGASYGAMAMAQQGFYEPPQMFVNPQAFRGIASDGRDLASLLRAPQIGALQLIAQGVPTEAALAGGLGMLERIVRTQISDAGRAAASVDVASRNRIGYVRMLNPPSCPDCLILAGRWYRYNQGFLRHPNCDCVHIPAREAGSGDATTDPYSYFNSLSEAEQNKLLGAASAEAVREGSDIYQVVNAKRGRSLDKMTTTEGTTRRGNFGRTGRLTPDGIYAQNLSRTETRILLERNGYILPGGQVPGGSIRSPSMGSGSPLTAADRRLRDSQLRYEAVLAGRNPYSRDGRGLTPMISAQVETDYRRWLTTGGQIYVN